MISKSMESHVYNKSCNEKNIIKEHILLSLELVAIENASLLTARGRRNDSFDYSVLGTLNG